jgi:hypothetical protein
METNKKIEVKSVIERIVFFESVIKIKKVLDLNLA